MAFPKYFKKFPNVDYALSINKAGKTSNVSISASSLSTLSMHKNVNNVRILT